MKSVVIPDAAVLIGNIGKSQLIILKRGKFLAEIPVPGIPSFVGADLFCPEQQFQISGSQGERNRDFNILLPGVKVRRGRLIFSHSSGNGLENGRFPYTVLPYQDQGRSDIPEDHIFDRLKILYLEKRNFHGLPPFW